MNTRICLSVLAAAAALGLASVSRANLVTDPDFSTWTNSVSDGSSDFTGWTLYGDTGYDGQSGYAPAGDSSSWIDGAVGSVAWQEQGLTTVTGDEYTISFWLAPSGGNQDYVAWNWTPTGSGSTPPGSDVVWSDVFGTITSSVGYSVIGTSGSWTEYQLDPMATSDFTGLAFGIQNNPSYDYLTGVDVEGASAVPDAASSAILLGVGLMGLAVLRRRAMGAC